MKVFFAVHRLISMFKMHCLIIIAHAWLVLVGFSECFWPKNLHSLRSMISRIVNIEVNIFLVMYLKQLITNKMMSYSSNKCFDCPNKLWILSDYTILFFLKCSLYFTSLLCWMLWGCQIISSHELNQRYEFFKQKVLIWPL